MHAIGQHMQKLATISQYVMLSQLKVCVLKFCRDILNLFAWTLALYGMAV